MTGATNFIIKGQTLNTNNYRKNQDNTIFSSLNDMNIYQQCCMAGVYMIDGGEGNVANIKPIFCSVQDSRDIGMDIYQDNAYLVYPGFGFQLFTGTNYAGTKSCIYYNAGTKPYVYVLDNTNWPGATKRVYQFGYDNIDGYQYPNDATQSMRIYFRGNLISVNGLS